MGVEPLVGFIWILGFPLVVYLINLFFKHKNGGTSIPHIYVSGITFYLIGLIAAITLIL